MFIRIAFRVVVLYEPNMGKIASRIQRTLALRSAADALDAFLEKHGGRDRAHISRLWEHWEMVLGQELASLASPLGHRKDTLIVAAEDSMAAQDIAMQAQDVLERVNAFMNSAFFSRLQVELVMGRSDLSRPVAIRRPPPPIPRPQKPEPFGSLTGYDPLSPAGQCYDTFRRLFSRN